MLLISVSFCVLVAYSQVTRFNKTYGDIPECTYEDWTYNGHETGEFTAWNLGDNCLHGPFWLSNNIEQISKTFETFTSHSKLIIRARFWLLCSFLQSQSGYINLNGVEISGDDIQRVSANVCSPLKTAPFDASWMNASSCIGSTRCYEDVIYIFGHSDTSSFTVEFGVNSLSQSFAQQWAVSNFTINLEGTFSPTLSPTKLPSNTPTTVTKNPTNIPTLLTNNPTSNPTLNLTIDNHLRKSKNFATANGGSNIVIILLSLLVVILLCVIFYKYCSDKKQSKQNQNIISQNIISDIVTATGGELEANKSKNNSPITPKNDIEFANKEPGLMLVNSLQENEVLNQGENLHFPNNFINWSKQDILKWLKFEVNLEKYSQLFTINAIDSEILKLWSEQATQEFDNELKMMGIEAYGDRAKIRKAITNLNQN